MSNTQYYLMYNTRSATKLLTVTIPALIFFLFKPWWQTYIYDPLLSTCYQKLANSKSSLCLHVFALVSEVCLLTSKLLCMVSWLKYKTTLSKFIGFKTLVYWTSDTTHGYG